MLLSRLKSHIEELPEPLGRPLARVPFALRFGWPYVAAGSRIGKALTQSAEGNEETLLVHLQRLLSHAYHHVPFYGEHYRRQGFHPEALKSLRDWSSVPVITKQDLQSVALSERSARGLQGLKINTGGTSGQPLEFLLDRQAFAREWAHMHYLWKARGYRPGHLKLTFRGKHFQESQVLRYNAVHNEYLVNANAPMHRVLAALQALPRGREIRWLHGYPSLVAEFAHQVADIEPSERLRLQSCLFGVLLGSEYPAPAYRNVIENVLSSNIVTWYGHSEMALLARETAHGVYQSLPSYGHAEALPSDPGGEHRLICTSLHNHVHPFIRYDTGDLIQPQGQEAGALSFRIAEGRVGDFVTDRKGQKHSLTAIVFGRHHSAFELLRHLQLQQVAAGRVTLLVTPKDPTCTPEELWRGFDLDDLDIEWNMEILSAPVRTRAGKIRLKLSDELDSEVA